VNTTPVIIPAPRLKLDGCQEGRVVVSITFNCVPIRPVVPSNICVDFDIVGVEKKISLDDEAVSVLKKWPKDGVINAVCFSEIAPPSRLHLPQFAAGQELILVVRNIYNNSPRTFTCAWLVHEVGS
jgi:hypothetical protein